MLLTHRRYYNCSIHLPLILYRKVLLILHTLIPYSALITLCPFNNFHYLPITVHHLPYHHFTIFSYVSAKAKGNADLDWSAIGLDISQDAGIDVSKDLARNKKDVAEGNNY